MIKKLTIIILTILIIFCFIQGIAVCQSITKDKDEIMVSTNIDTNPPEISITSPTNSSKINSTTVILKGIALDMESGLQKVQVSKNINTGWITVLGTDLWLFEFHDLPDGINHFYVRAIDKAGNKSKIASIKIVVNVPSGEKKYPSDGVIEPALGGYNKSPHFNFYRKTDVNAALRSLVVPGWGQYFNGQKAKAYIIGGVELASISCSIIFYSLSSKTYNEYDIKGRVDDKLYDEYKSQILLTNISIGTAITTWIFSVVDAYLCGKREINYSIYSKKESNIDFKVSMNSQVHMGYKFKI